MQQRLNDLATDLVGDCGSPNVFFVSNAATGNVVAIFVAENPEDAIHLANSRDEPMVVEDRQIGVVYEKPSK